MKWWCASSFTFHGLHNFHKSMVSHVVMHCWICSYNCTLHIIMIETYIINAHDSKIATMLHNIFFDLLITKKLEHILPIIVPTGLLWTTHILKYYNQTFMSFSIHSMTPNVFFGTLRATPLSAKAMMGSVWSILIWNLLVITSATSSTIWLSGCCNRWKGVILHRPRWAAYRAYYPFHLSPHNKIWSF